MSDWFWNSATKEKMAKTRADRWNKDPSDVIPLTTADPDFHIAPEIKNAVIKAVLDEDFNYTMLDKTLEEKVAQKITKSNEIPAKVEDVFMTNGTAPGISIAARYACKPGEEAIVNDPMYYLIPMLAEACGAKLVKWDLNYEEDYKFDVETLKEIITPKTKLLYLCNPHNPTGRVMTQEELKAVADVAVDHNIVVCSDELWEDVLFDGRKHISIASLNPEIERLTMTQFGFSKAYNVAGLRVGYLCITDKEMMEKAGMIGFSSLMVPTNFGKAAGHVMISEEMEWWHKGMMAHLLKIRGICEKWFEEMPNVSCPKLEGTYLMFPRFDYDISSEKLEEYLVENVKVRLRHGSAFGDLGEKHQRVLIATSEEIITEGLARVKQGLEDLN